MKGFFSTDERTERLNGIITSYVLFLTQAAFSLMIAYKRYVLGMDTVYYQGFDLILIISMLVYWAARLFLNGILPAIHWKWMLLIYAISVAVISIPSALIHGLPTAENWSSTILPAALGPAVILLGYWFLTYLGKRRLDKEI